MSIQTFKPVKEGKVREVYDIGDSLIITATDRISAFDVILKNKVEKKGTILTKMSEFWFDFTKDILPNHMISTDVKDMPEFFQNERFDGNSMKCKKLEMLPVECLVVNNIFRDQLDRYGEITHTLNAIREGITHVPDATLCLNADCSLTSSLADDVPNKVVWFGVDVPIYKETAFELSDAVYCIHCKTEYEYDYRTYSHLGGFRCPKCGYHRQTPQVGVTQVVRTGADSSDIVLNAFGHNHDVHINLPGGYNIYNAAACVAAAEIVGIDEDTAVDALSRFECGFGRAEQFELGKSKARMMLVKNPAGYNQVINQISNDEEECKIAFLLNDRYADGTDISWIWDVDFEALARQSARFTRILVSGVRADDMALRLKYAGFDTGRIEVIRDYENLLEAIGADETPTFIMPTYTAMFDLRGEISKHTDIKAFYE